MSLAVEMSFEARTVRAKRLDPRLRQKRLTMAKMWTRILEQGLEQPVCPKCDKKLKVVSLSKKYTLVDINSTPFSEVTVVFECPLCLDRLRCRGSNLQIKDGNYIIDDLILEEVKECKNV